MWFGFLNSKFGLYNTLTTYDQSCAERLSGICQSYINDILIFSNSWEEHMGHIQEVFAKLQEIEYYSSVSLEEEKYNT